MFNVVSSMHPLRVILIVSVAVAAAIATAFGYALHRLAVPSGEAIVIAIAVFAAFLVPWGAVSLWSVRRASDLDELTDRSRRVAEGEYQRVIADREFHGEVDDLARAAEELRRLVLRQKESYAEQSAALQRIVGAIGEGLMALD